MHYLSKNTEKLQNISVCFSIFAPNLLTSSLNFRHVDPYSCLSNISSKMCLCVNRVHMLIILGICIIIQEHVRLITIIMSFFSEAKSQIRTHKVYFSSAQLMRNIPLKKRLPIHSLLQSLCGRFSLLEY